MPVCAAVNSITNATKNTRISPLTRQSFNRLKTLIFTTMLAVLSACGGGSGGDNKVTPVNQAPTFTSADTFSTLDNQLNSGYRATATDKEGDNITYTISGGSDASDFFLDNATGELTFVIAPDFEAPHDDNTDNIYELEITATDIHDAVEQLMVKIIVSGNRVLVRIPVVVHVLYYDDENDQTNISDEKILSQIDVLNLTFRKQNTDLIDIPQSLTNQVADMQIEFFLANIDPNGEPTDGITRTERLTNGVPLYDETNLYSNVHFTERGGHDAWPTDKYLNIWVLELDSHSGDILIAGQAQLPGGDPLTDGVLVAHRAFGTLAPLASGFHLGRTATHEVGHWLGLQHSGSPFNFMAIATDDKMLMFTQEQKQQVYAVFSTGGGRETFYQEN